MRIGPGRHRGACAAPGHHGPWGGSWLAIERRSYCATGEDPRNYDAEHYVRVLHENFASRLARAFTPGDFAALFADPDQGALFPVTFGEIRAVLKQLA